MKYVSGAIISRTVLVDPLSRAVIKPISVGLTLESVSLMHGGRCTVEGGLGISYTPIPQRVVLEDNKRRYYDIVEGAYQVRFNQALKDIPDDMILTISSSNDLIKTGAFIVSEKIYKHHSMGSLCSVLIVPNYCRLTLEIGSPIADLYLHTWDWVPEAY